VADFQYQKEVTPWEEPGVEPQPGLRKWQAGEEPPAGWFNWFWDAVQKCFADTKLWINGHKDANTGVHGVGTGHIETVEGAQAKVNTGISNHSAAADPHPVYATDSNLTAHNQANTGVHGVGTGHVETSEGAQTKVNNAISAHLAAADPHPVYATDSELSAHLAAADPHPVYATDSDLTAHNQANTGVHGIGTGHIETVEGAQSKVNTGISNHLAAADPHPVYATDSNLTAHNQANTGVHGVGTGYVETTEGAQTKVNNAISAHLAASDPHKNGVPTGAGPLPYFGATPPAGWLFCDGKTIGDSSSGATSRANLDTLDLFQLLWSSVGNTELLIQNADGSAGTRGTTALGDFNAHKRLPLPDLRGRFVLGKDNMGGQSANRVTSSQADLLGGSSGSEAVTLNTDQIPAHTHPASFSSGSTSSAGSHQHNIYSTSYQQYGTTTGLDTISYGGGLSARSGWIGSDGAHTHSVSGTVTVSNNSTSGSSHNNMPPYLSVNYIIKY
jgi:microcystin-dependent protein